MQRRHRNAAAGGSLSGRQFLRHPARPFTSTMVEVVALNIVSRKQGIGMATLELGGTWKGLWISGLLGRFVLLCLGVWLHAADTLVTATVTPAIVDEIGGIAYVRWTSFLYQIGAIVGGGSNALRCRPGRVEHV